MDKNGLNIRVVADTQEDIFIDFSVNKKCNFRSKINQWRKRNINGY